MNNKYNKILNEEFDISKMRKANNFLKQRFKESGLSDTELSNIKLSMVHPVIPEIPETTEQDEDDDTVFETPLLPKDPPPYDYTRCHSDDPAFKAYEYAMRDNIRNDEFKNALLDISKAHYEIIKLYNNYLYEDTWDEATENRFNELLESYNHDLEVVTTLMPLMIWNKTSNKEKFLLVFKEIVKADNDTFNRIRARHISYEFYRANRNSIIKKLNSFLGNFNEKNARKYDRVFTHLCLLCERIPLYKYDDDKNKFIPVLIKWQGNRANMSELLDYANQFTDRDHKFELEDMYNLFKRYIYCRKMAYKIFNMITSNSKVNGYEKWHDILDGYVNDRISTGKVKQLYNAAMGENMEDVDDYFQYMDEKSWRDKGIFESQSNWFDEDMKYYSLLKKDRASINSINMISTNANQCKILMDGNSLYSQVTFYPGDIIEVCPTRVIDKSSLYSKDMRDLVFEVIPNQEWVLPFGYCQYYDIPTINNIANCDFLWDPDKRVIIIKAIKRIPKHTKLVLNNIK